MFYDNLINECKRQGLKATPLVVECGGASGSISGWKKGSIPNSEIVLKLAARLNVSCDYLLTGEKSLSSNDLSDDVCELINIYNELDSRGRHKLHTLAYDELDRIKNTNIQQSKKDVG